MHQLRKYLTREQIFTVPNFMSFFRIVLLPFIVWTYWKGSYDVAVGLLILSALTDALDGVIARRFNMVTDLGKMLDPLSDKLTHGALFLCLALRYPYVWIAFGLLAVKELTMFFLGTAAIRHRGAVHSAQWYGKLCTAILEISMAVMILFPKLPERWVLLLLGLCCAAMIFSLIMYVIYLCGLIRAEHLPQKEETPPPEVTE